MTTATAARDIKPDNLFILSKRAVIGDFGLVSYPEKCSVTASGERLGPLFYVAPELLGNTIETIDFRPGDVYSLAKTLWVLATGQRYPLPGTLDSTERACRLSSFVEHERAVILDVLLESSTAVDPVKRPSSKLFAHELRAWIENKTVTIGALNVPIETAVEIQQFTKAVSAQAERRNLLNSEFPKILSAVHAHLIEMGRQVSEVAGVPHRSKTFADGNHNIAVGYFPPINGADHVGNRAFQEFIDTFDGKQITLTGGAVVERVGLFKGSLLGGLVIDVVGKAQVCWKYHAEFDLGSSVQQTAVNNFIEGMHQHIPGMMKEVLQILRNRSSSRGQ